MRDEIVAILTRQLDLFERADEELNAFVISALLDLKAVESAPVMERAFAADRVDLSVCGDWSNVQVELGLKAPPVRITSPLPQSLLSSRPAQGFPFAPGLQSPAATAGAGQQSGDARKGKSKNKATGKGSSRKGNRKRG